MKSCCITQLKVLLALPKIDNRETLSACYEAPAVRL